MRPEQNWIPIEQLINEIQIDRLCGNVFDEIADTAIEIVHDMYRDQNGQN